MSRPGLLLYFDIVPALDKLPLDAVGELLLKALHYAQDGVEPVFDDASLGFAWAFLRPSIDRDGAAYQDKRLKGDWLVYCRRCKQDGTQALSFEMWRQHIDNGTLQSVDATSPTPSTTSTQNQPSSNTSPTPNGILYCAEPETDSTPPVITLPLNDGSEYPVSQEQCQEWAGLYPAVDVMQQLRGMRGWLLSNPERRKTKRGIGKFINNWLAKEQNRGGRNVSSGYSAPRRNSNQFLDMLEEEHGQN